jgi:PAS domain S-box-containing protein
MATHLGLSPEMLVHYDYDRFLAGVSPDDREEVERALARAQAEKTDYNTTYRTIWPDGSTHWVLARGRYIDDLYGKSLHLLGATLDITELKQAEEALQESEARFRALVDSNLIGIAVSDLKGTLLEANDAFLDLVGYTREDLAAGCVQWAAMTPPAYQEQHQQVQEELLKTGKVQPYEKEYQAKNGRRVPVLVGRTLFRRACSAPLTISFVVDLTARKEVEQQKDLFLSITSHELKTPLAALRGTLQLSERRLKRIAATSDHVPPEWSTFAQELKKNLEDGVRQIDVQTSLINDLLDLSRITANTLKLSPQRCDLGNIVRDTVEDVRVTAPDRSLELALPEDSGVFVLADRDRIS